MLCSIPTGKSGSSWLDRLRSSKGFPAAEQVDLEQFLKNQTPSTSNSPDTNVTDSTANQIDPNSRSNPAQPDRKPDLDGDQTTETNAGDGEREWFGVMSNVLSELFYMGDHKSISKKSCRKQRNPKICHLSTSKINEDACTVTGALPLSLQNSRQKKEMTSQLKLKEQEGVNVGLVDGEEEEEEKENADLSGFSRTEVTVIDTSVPSWKFDKLLFRRKNVWKVRDRKCKSIIPNRRKRKASLVSGNGCAGEEKKQCSSSKDMDREEGLVQSHGGNGQSNKIKGASKQTIDVHGKVQEKGQGGIPKKLKEGSSSIVLIKSIPTSKKNGANIPKSCTKTVQRQH